MKRQYVNIGVTTTSAGRYKEQLQCTSLETGGPHKPRKPVI